MLQQPRGIHSKAAEVAECVCVPVSCPIPPFLPLEIFFVCVCTAGMSFFFFFSASFLDWGEVREIQMKEFSLWSNPDWHICY